MIEGRRLKIAQEYRSELRSSIRYLLGFAALVALPLFLPRWEWTSWQALFLLANAGVFLAFAAKYYRLLQTLDDDEIAVDASGISRRDPEQGWVRLAWAEIRTITDQPQEKRLELHSSSAGPPFRLEYQLEGFEELVRRLQKQQEQQRQIFPLALPITFTKRTMFTVSQILLPVLLALIGRGLFDDLGWFGGMLSVMPALLLTLVLATPTDSVRRLLIYDTGLRCYERFDATDIGFHEIEAIDLVVQKNSGGSVTRLNVVARLTDAKERSLLPHGCDAFVVYRALSASWEQDKTSQMDQERA